MQISTSIDPASTLTDIDLINLAMAIEQVLLMMVINIIWQEPRAVSQPVAVGEVVDNWR